VGLSRASANGGVVAVTAAAMLAVMTVPELLMDVTITLLADPL
jgi:hypothetical protein